MTSKKKLNAFLICFFFMGFENVEPEEQMLYEIQNAPIDFESHPWPCISSAATDLVKKMLIRNPKKRITAAKFLGKPLFFSFLLLFLMKCLT